MRVIEVKNLDFIKLEKENCLLSLLDKSSHYDVMIAKIAPKETLTMHKHNRPDNGDEIFVFFEGGQFKVLTDEEIEEFNVRHPVFIRFESKEPHSVVNLSDEELRFFGFYVPPFQTGEAEVLSSSVHLT